MERTSTASTKVGLGLIAIVFAISAYRAATQSFTTDEALTFLRFISPRWIDTWQDYDANNHILHGLLARLFAKALGKSELVLRLPALLGGGAYLAGAWILARRVFRSGPLFLAALGLMVLNPLVLDHLASCRGYALAMAGWIWGLLLLWDYLESGAVSRMHAGAVVLALGVCANLAFLFPVASMAVVFAAVVVARKGRGGLVELADRFAVPAAMVGFIVLLLPMQSAGPSNFYYGAKLLDGAVGELAEMSLFRHQLGDLGLAKYVLPVMRGLCAFAMVAAVWSAVRALRRKLGGPADAFLVLGGGTAALAALAIVAAHYAAGMPYPENRTALYWIPLLSVMSIAAVQEAQWKPLTVIALVATALCVGRYATQVRLDSFGEWPDDAGMKKLAAVLKREGGTAPVRVCAVHARAITLGYYRVRLSMPQWTIREVEKVDAACEWSIVPAGEVEARSAVYRDGRIALIRGGTR